MTLGPVYRKTGSIVDIKRCANSSWIPGPRLPYPVLLVRSVSPKSQIDSLPRKNMANQANRSASLRRKCSVAGIKFRRPTVPVYSEEGI